MFDVAPTELLVVAVIALIVIGPKDLPKAMRVVGYWIGRARGVARQFRSGFDAMVREAELEEMEKKWKEENERIMREHAAATSFPELDATAPQQPPLALTADPVPEAPSPEMRPSLEKAEDADRGEADPGPEPAAGEADTPAPPPPAPEERPYWLDKHA